MFLRQQRKTKSTSANVRESTELKVCSQANMRGNQTTVTDTIEEIQSQLCRSINKLANEAPVFPSNKDLTAEPETSTKRVQDSFLLRTVSLDRVLQLFQESNDSTHATNSQHVTQDEIKELVDHVHLDTTAKRRSETSTFNYDDLFKSGSLPVNNAYNSNRATNVASARQCPANDQSDDNRTYDVITDESLDEINTNLSESSINNDTTTEYIVGRIT